MASGMWMVSPSDSFFLDHVSVLTEVFLFKQEGYSQLLACTQDFCNFEGVFPPPIALAVDDCSFRSYLVYLG